eukprot:5644313-Pyramimonas_sp.AAC.1
MWGRETLCWVGETHANTATEALRGAPIGATKRCPGWGAHVNTATRALGGERCGATKRCPGWGGACEHRLWDL